MSPLNPAYTTSNSSPNPDAESVYSLHSLRDSLRSASPASSIQSTEAPSEVDLEQYGIQSSGDQSFVPVADMEVLAHQLFSVEHLKLILQSPQHFPRFQNFLTRYRPQLAISLKRYLDVQKAIAATKYANALAESLWPGLVAATADPEFIRKLDTAFMPLFEEALPSYVTHRMTSLVTEILVKEITGQAVPALKSLVNGLAEVYCLTDPRLPDNPIIYASSQFYAATGYGPNAVIGKNCRFLQGKGTSRVAVMRLIEALQDGQEICETMLNYRKDGSPFVNLLLIAPLHDVDGKVRYFIGAQIDINGLVEEGRGLDSFASLLARDRQNSVMGKAPPQTPMGAIAELGSFMNEHDRKILNAAAGAGSNHTGGRSDRRKMFGMNDAEDSELWPAPSLGPNGRLPGVFQNVSRAAMSSCSRCGQPC
jgi:PAS domain S-box-containing protein